MAIGGRKGSGDHGPARCAGLLARVALAAGIVLVAGLAASPLQAAPAGLSAPPDDFKALSARVEPAVVTILAQNTETRRASHGEAPTTRIHTRVGSGVAVGDNEIVTTASVVIRAERVLVRTANGLQAEAQIAGVDPVFNVALLRVPGLRLPALPFASERGGQIGDWVLTVGSSYRFQLTQSAGSVSAFYKEPRLAMLQLTNSVSPGNSGGAAVNSRGELVGIVQGELGTPELGIDSDRERRPTGMSFVLPADLVQRVYVALRREGRVHHGWFGVTTSGAVVASESEKGADIPIGARVENVIPGSPAAKLGLQKGDLIVGFEGERVEYPGQLARWVAATPPGTAVGFVWVRGELQKVGSSVLGDSPDVAPAWAVTPGGAGGHASAGSTARIAEAERQLRSGGRAVARLKGQSTSTRRE